MIYFLICKSSLELRFETDYKTSPFYKFKGEVFAYDSVHFIVQDGIYNQDER